MYVQMITVMPLLLLSTRHATTPILLAPLQLTYPNSGTVLTVAKFRKGKLVFRPERVH